MSRRRAGVAIVSRELVLLKQRCGIHSLKENLIWWANASHGFVGYVLVTSQTVYWRLCLLTFVLRLGLLHVRADATILQYATHTQPMWNCCLPNGIISAIVCNCRLSLVIGTLVYARKLPPRDPVNICQITRIIWLWNVGGLMSQMSWRLKHRVRHSMGEIVGDLVEDIWNEKVC